MDIEQKYVSLGELELEILDILWEKSVVTVKDIHETLLRKRDIAYTTVMTVMSRLFDKGILERSQTGRTYVYKPQFTRDQIAHNLMNRVKNKIFHGSLEGIFSYMLSQKSISSDELSKLKEIIEESEKRING
jgi:predicted transcriptional regulator